MYETRYTLRQRPFAATPDATAYYPATTHEQALTRLAQGLDDGAGVVLLTGPAGSGKTLLAHVLLGRLGPDVASAFLTNSHLNDRTDLLQALLFELSLPHEGREQELRLRLTDFLLRNFAAGRRAVLVVDEGQNLPADVLEELRLLGNLEAGAGKAVQVVLVGQDGLLMTLGRPELLPLCQRVTVRARLEPLDVEEAADYLRHQVRRAGGQPLELFTDEALELLARRTHGLPRLLNHAAHQALQLADAAEAGQVDCEAALEALAALGLAAEDADAADAAA
jgi:type II secretory pathway predicted ATPase ExeA